MRGDIVQVKYKTTSWGRKVSINFSGIVAFGEFQADDEGDCVEGWHIKSKGNLVSLAEHNDFCEVIDNIHENPELLEVKMEV